ncbi:MAG: hypothetical protein LBE38_06690 [Deltaproteobacteria bacterium]|jgi:hypothetical protein|nr:hypothetical protein [Deltaproteobacteria bacterium]
MKFGTWSTRDLAVIGVLAALSRALGLITVFALGGMNPLSLSLRAMIITVLFIVLRIKVRVFGTLVLATAIGSLTSFFIMARGITSLPLVLLCALIAEIIIVYIGQNKVWAIIIVTSLLGVLEKAVSLLFMYLSMREAPAMMWPIVFLTAISSIGDLIALFIAPRFVKELRHAGFINA